MTPKALDVLIQAVGERWPGKPGAKAQRYVGKFFGRVRRGRKLQAQVEGNHGVYTVSIEAAGGRLDAACACYIGGSGSCHHVDALATTFLLDPDSFEPVKVVTRNRIRTPDQLRTYLKGVSLKTLLDELKERGITRTTFAQSIGMNPRHLSSIQSSEARHHYYNELGAAKLACLWAIEHLQEDPPPKKKPAKPAMTKRRA